MPGSQTTSGSDRTALAITRPPFLLPGVKQRRPRVDNGCSQLNGWPIRSPTDASPRSRGPPSHGSGATFMSGIGAVSREPPSPALKSPPLPLSLPFFFCLYSPCHLYFFLSFRPFPCPPLRCYVYSFRLSPCFLILIRLFSYSCYCLSWSFCLNAVRLTSKQKKKAARLQSFLGFCFLFFDSFLFLRPAPFLPCRSYRVGGDRYIRSLIGPSPWLTLSPSRFLFSFRCSPAESSIPCLPPRSFLFFPLLL